MSGSPSATQKLEELLTPPENDTYLQNVLHSEKDTVQTPEKSSDTPADEVETIEKIAEMISNARRDSPEKVLDLSECCPMTKKQRQVLLSQRMDNDLSNTKSAGKQSENIEAINLSKSGAVAGNANEKCKFEEVEIKLEEMFAGIEDEQTTNVHSKGTEIYSQNAACTTDTGKCELNAKKEKTTTPTKAAIKSADSAGFSLQPSVVDDIVGSSNAKNIPPRRRLSMAMQSPICLEKRKNVLPDEKDVVEKDLRSLSNSNNASARSNKDVSNNNNMMAKKKQSFANKRKGFNDKKKGRMQNVKHKRKPTAKVEEAPPTKSKSLKLKNRRSHNSSSSCSENDLDERGQQTNDAKYRSPYVLVKNDGSISVVNTTTADESSDKSKRTGAYVPERRNVRGIYSSTLSNKYDADTADSTWICVYCKRGPHKKGLGDLFGPYVINIDNEEYRIMSDIRTKYETPVCSKRKRIDSSHSNTSSPISRKCELEDKTTLNAHETANNFNNCESSQQDFLIGMSRMSPSSFEVWFHEDCAVWTPNLYLVGSRLVGLDSSIWQSTLHTCVCCLKNGAIICCLQRECKETAHLPCARESNWNLDETKFWAYCAKHQSPTKATSAKNEFMPNRIELLC